MLWRARVAPGWVEGSASRQRLFREEEDQLYLEIKSLQPQKDGLLGNPSASKQLREWAPRQAHPKVTKAATCAKLSHRRQPKLANVN
jgi:hypothetical protein